LQSHGQPLKQERGFSAVRSDIGDASPDLLHQFYGLMTPQACCLDSNREKDVRGLELLILRSLVVCCLLGCRSLLN